MQNHTDLKGGLITSTQKAENNGKNRFETGTLTFEDLANHAEYKGEAIGLGVSGSVKGENPNNPNSVVADKTGMSSTMGYGKDSDKQYATTHLGQVTLGIYAIHQTVITLLAQSLSSLTPWLLVTINFTVGLLASLLIIFILRKSRIGRYILLGENL